MSMMKRLGMLVATVLLGWQMSSADTYLVIDINEGPDATNYPVSYLSAVPSGGWTEDHKTTKIVLRKISNGTFTMGSPSGELGRYTNETQHQVTLSKDFYIGVFEVTQKQWERVMGDWPSYFTNATYRDSRPVDSISYYEIRENQNNSAISPNWPDSDQVNTNSFMGKLRAKTGLITLDLPTESQWEYACRAGTTTALNSGKNLTATEECPNMSEVGRYWYNGGSTYSQGCMPSAGSATVGSYSANAWGLFDMHGNVWEWCLDWYETYPGTVTDPDGAASGSARVARSGSWYSSGGDYRSAKRNGATPSGRGNSLGFRLAMTQPSADPDPDLGPSVRANGQRGTVIVSQGQSITITVTMAAGNYIGVNADWWVVAMPSHGSIWHYLNSLMAWVEFPANDFSALQPALQGPLVNVPEPVTVLPAMTLPRGTYIFYFAVDQMDGILNYPEGSILFDYVTVVVE